MTTDIHTPRGSSPHTRGARVEPHAGLLSRRIIPAYAGSTAHQRTMSPRNADHPRIRGEHYINATRLRQISGSSPHTRGAQEF